jgi:hypothetical protein
MFNTFPGIWSSRARASVSINVQTLMVVSCDTVITLVAQVIGILTDRTYEWVQLTGTPVDWLESRFQTSVMFNQTAVRDDKVFRFYVDKGKRTEAYKDVIVTAVPRDTATTVNESSTFQCLPYTSSELIHSITALPGLSAVGQNATNSAVRMLTWINPLEIYFSSATVIKTSLPTFSEVVNKTFYLNGVFWNETYQLRALHDYYGVQRIVNSPAITLTQTGEYVDADASDKICLYASDMSVQSSILEVITRELVTLPFESDSAMNFTASISGSFCAGSILQILTIGISSIG